MSRKDPRKSIAICPNRQIWVALKAQAGCSLSDVVRKKVLGTDWMHVPVGEVGRGTELSVQLPPVELRTLEMASLARGVTAERLILGALSQDISCD